MRRRCGLRFNIGGRGVEGCEEGGWVERMVEAEVSGKGKGLISLCRGGCCLHITSSKAIKVGQHCQIELEDVNEVSDPAEAAAT